MQCVVRTRPASVLTPIRMTWRKMYVKEVSKLVKISTIVELYAYVILYVYYLSYLMSKSRE